MKSTGGKYTKYRNIKYLIFAKPENSVLFFPLISISETSVNLLKLVKSALSNRFYFIYF